MFYQLCGNFDMATAHIFLTPCILKCIQNLKRNQKILFTIVLVVYIYEYNEKVDLSFSINYNLMKLYVNWIKLTFSFSAFLSSLTGRGGSEMSGMCSGGWDIVCLLVLSSSPTPLPGRRRSTGCPAANATNTVLT